MKATIDIPDELYEKVEAKSASEGRPVEAVAVELFRRWLEQDNGSAPQVSVDQAPVDDAAAVERRRMALDAQEWLATWLKSGAEDFKNAPPGPSAREILDEGRNRLERR